MNADLVIAVLKHSVATGAMVVAPVLMVSILVGVLVGALQAATQVSEPTLTFVPKVLAVGLVGALILPWALDRMVGLFLMVFEQVPLVVGR